MQNEGRHCYRIVTLAIVLLVGMPYAEGSAYSSGNQAKSDNFDLVLELFKNHYLQTFFNNDFLSITQGPTLLRLYCANNRKMARVNLPDGYANVYCIRDKPYLNSVMLLNLLDEGMQDSRKRSGWLAAEAVLKKNGFVTVCTRHCKNGMLPTIRYGTYTRPTSKTTFSVGCKGIFTSSCTASCSNGIYEVKHGKVSCSLDTLIGSTCRVKCVDGYINVGPDTLKCNRTQQWDSTQHFKCLPEDVGEAVKNLMKYDEMTLNEALNNLRKRVERFLGEKSHIAPSTRQETIEETDAMISEEELIEQIQKFFASLEVTNAVTLKGLGTCSKPPKERKDCGYGGITKKECYRRGCCWDDSLYNTIWCFHKENVVKPLRNTSKQVSKYSQQHRHVQSTNEVNPLHRPHSSQFNHVMPSTSIQPMHDFPNRHSYSQPVSEGGSQSSQCGCVEPQQYVQPFARVFCGQSITVERSPWHAIVYYDEKLCGGTLISKNFVITAAHCLDPKPEVNHDDNVVYLGVSIRINDKQDKAIQKRQIRKVIRHPQYSTTGSSSVQNDIALIQLSRPIERTASVRALCLPGNFRPAYGTRCYITGFGEKSVTAGSPANKLQRATLLVTSPDKCTSIYQSFKKDQNICAGPEKKDGADTCRGDSGGPLACQRRQGDGCSWYLAGITSYGKEPCGGGTPGVYVDVYHYQEWIRANTDL